MKKYLIILLLVVITVLAFVWINFRFNELERKMNNEIIVSREYISHTLVMWSEYVMEEEKGTKELILSMIHSRDGEHIKPKKPTKPE
jgi:hypothetical protein